MSAFCGATLLLLLYLMTINPEFAHYADTPSPE
jgi:hypothetical protein